MQTGGREECVLDVRCPFFVVTSVRAFDFLEAVSLIEPLSARVRDKRRQTQPPRSGSFREVEQLRTYSSAGEIWIDIQLVDPLVSENEHPHEFPVGALSMSADDYATIPVREEEQVPPTMVIGLRPDCSRRFAAARVS